MFRFLFILAVMLMPTMTYAATCAAGQYLNNGECVACAAVSYCPGDNKIYSCASLWNKQAGITIINDFNSVLDPTGPDGCICYFMVQTPNSPTTTHQAMTGKCADGPTDYLGIDPRHCRAGYYPFEQFRYADAVNLYKQCAPCTNEKPDNTVYSEPGQANANNCPWKCVDGYTTNKDGTACDQLCTLGYTKLKTSTGVTIPLFAQKRTSPSINIGAAGAACFADLAIGQATGAINIKYNNQTYHTIPPTTTLICDIGYYLDANNTCKMCENKYYCPGGNQRISCETTIPPQEDGPAPQVYGSDTRPITKPESCWCRWDNLSDERRAKYFIIAACYLGLRPNLSYGTYVKYFDCQIGHYATGYKPRGDNYYLDCAPCTNGPENSHYTSYSTPSVIGAEESNCPWECDDGFIANGDTCIAKQ